MPQTLTKQAASSSFVDVIARLRKHSVVWRMPQWVLCRVLQMPLYFLCTFTMRYVAGFRIANIQEIRKRYCEIAKTPGPLIICSNHLTFIDSMILIWAFGGNFWYFFNFSRFSWNLPAGDFFKKKWHYRLLASIAKCIFIHRDGPKEHKNTVVGMCRTLLEAGETITFFPEGRRSRTGRFEADRLTFGVGKLVSMIGPCPVLCVYLRSDKQTSYSSYPAKNSTFHVAMELLHCAATEPGQEGYQNVISKVRTSIMRMEDQYFSSQS